MEQKERPEKNENGPLNLYKKTILWTKLSEAMEELKKENKISAGLEQKIITKFDEIICQELATQTKTKNSIKGTVTSFRNCDDIWIFYCKDIILKLDNKNEISIAKLKIIALDEELRNRNKSSNNTKYNFNPVGEG